MAIAIFAQVFDNTTIKFHFVEREQAKVAQRRIAADKIVERGSHAKHEVRAALP